MTTKLAGKGAGKLWRDIYFKLFPFKLKLFTSTLLYLQVFMPVQIRTIRLSHYRFAGTTGIVRLATAVVVRK
ncbi:MAG: hypothetical protein EBZ36_07885 [Acidobacteria bacterium]|nr:hypothetical protein [Acidobacteriota bacterium]